MMLSLSLLALCLITTAKGQFHRDCSTQDALSKRHCCPVFEGSECGSGSGRGSCQRYQLQDPDITDTRCNWPYQQYDEICSCNGNYDGPDCGDCKPYYHGPTCSEYIPCVRKELRELTAAEKKQFVDTLCLAKTTTSTRWVAQTGGTLGDVSTYTFESASEFDCMVAIHASSSMYVNVGEGWTVQDLIHHGPAFLPAHRRMLMHFERMLQNLSANKSLCLPYWDWTKDDNTCEVCTSDLMGSIGSDGAIEDPSCFADWKVACSDSNTHSFCQQAEDPAQRPQLRRNPEGSWSLPTESEVNDTVAWSEYDLSPFDTTSTECFRSIAEGYMDPQSGVNEGNFMHNLVHVTIGGHMNRLSTASNDAFFYVHHAQVDRIGAKWQWQHCTSSVDYPENDVPCQGPDDNIYPSLPPRPLNLYLNPPEYFGYSYSDQAQWDPSPCPQAS